MEIWVPVKALRAYFEENIAPAIKYFNILKIIHFIAAFLKK